MRVNPQKVKKNKWNSIYYSEKSKIIATESEKKWKLIYWKGKSESLSTESKKLK